MKESYKKGLSFGITSAVITTLGLIVGLNISTGSRIAVISGILIIAIADAFSDSLGIHISEETNKINNKQYIWEATISTFIFKLIFALSFVIPFLFFSLKLATIISVFWGVILLSFLSYRIGRHRPGSALKVISEHLIIAFLVIIISYCVGVFVNKIIF